ncbi:MAG: hypothetical protein ABR586_05575 [Thermoplasmatota archaeon]
MEPATRPLAEALDRPRCIYVNGHVLDTSACIQRYCTVRGCYVIQDLRDPFFCLETQHRLPELQLRGPRPPAREGAWVPSPPLMLESVEAA